MSCISKFDLISGSDIDYNGICVLHPPHLDEIRKMGFDKYNSYVGFLSMDVQKYLSFSSIDRSAVKNIADLRMFDIWVHSPEMRERFKCVLTFFISGEIEYVASYNAFKLICDGRVGIINRNNYQDIVSGILTLNCISYEKPEEVFFNDDASRELYEQMQKAKKTGELKAEDKNFSFSNLISSVAAYGNGYNLNNVWDLTVYQLFDQFYRLNAKFQLDIVGTRWAAWGKEDFDFDVWHRDITLLK